MELFEKIRKSHEREGLSIRELAKRYGTHRRTVRQALASALPPERKAPPPRSSPALEPWKATIDRWIEEDKQAPRKQRHTARRIYQRLREDYDADVGESTVRRYVAQRKQSVGVPLREVTVPQHHPLGATAEVDFGDVSFYLRGLPVVGKMFVMRLSASGKGFHRVYLHECQEAFLDGHVRAAEAFGGLPELIRYDNLTSAVTKVLRDGTAPRASGSWRCARTTASTRSSASPVCRARTRRAAWKARWDASGDGASSRCPGSTPSRS